MAATNSLFTEHWRKYAKQWYRDDAETRSLSFDPSYVLSAQHVFFVVRLSLISLLLCSFISIITKMLPFGSQRRTVFRSQQPRIRICNPLNRRRFNYAALLNRFAFLFLGGSHQTQWLHCIVLVEIERTIPVCRRFLKPKWKTKQNVTWIIYYIFQFNRRIMCNYWWIYSQFSRRWNCSKTALCTRRQNAVIAKPAEMRERKKRARRKKMRKSEKQMVKIKWPVNVNDLWWWWICNCVVKHRSVALLWLNTAVLFADSVFVPLCCAIIFFIALFSFVVVVLRVLLFSSFSSASGSLYFFFALRFRSPLLCVSLLNIHFVRGTRLMRDCICVIWSR